MAAAENSSLATRPSLLKRLKVGDDMQGWQDFYRLYGPLIRNFASKAGLLAGNHFATVLEGVEQLGELGRKVLWQGAQPLRAAES